MIIIICMYIPCGVGDASLCLFDGYYTPWIPGTKKLLTISPHYL